MRLNFVGLAAALFLAACKTTAPTLDVAAPTQTPPPGPPRFDTAIADFEKADKTAMPPRCATLFVGSSTVRRWASLKEDFPTRKVINRGFGGSTAWEVDAYFTRLAPPYHPGEIVFYAGDNDLSDTPARDGQPARAGRSPDAVYADFVHFMEMKDKALGSTPVWFIAIKPSKLRWAIQDKMTAVNMKVKALADRRDDLAYIDIVPVMLKPDGTPKDIFVEDNLHMTPEGYKLWAPIVNKALDAGQKAKAPGC
jgi:lysophospholipase L1-like esterase